MPEKATGTFEVKIVPQTDREIPTQTIPRRP